MSITHRATALFAGMIALFVILSFPAVADVYYVTYTGTVSGVDTYGLFGTVGAQLSQAAYTSTYAYSLSLGGSYYSSGSQISYIYGGSNDSGSTSPLVSATITINGQTYSQSSAFDGEEDLANETDYQSLYTAAKSSASNFLYNTALYAPQLIPSLTTLQSFAITPGDYASGEFSHGGETLGLSVTYFAVTNAAPPPPAPVPEPASLALLGGAACSFAAAFGTCRATSSRRKGAAGGRVVA